MLMGRGPVEPDSVDCVRLPRFPRGSASALGIRTMSDNPLAPFSNERSAALRAALEQALKAIEMDDLAAISDADILANTDMVQQSRIAYAVGLLRLNQFLRTKPKTFEQGEAQAKLGLAYVRHTEGISLKPLQPGRHIEDQALVQEVLDLRAENTRLVEAQVKRRERERAKAAEQGGTGSPPEGGPPEP